MKYAWLNRKNQPPSGQNSQSNSVSVRERPCQSTVPTNNPDKLIIFFAGWGMSPAPFTFLDSNDSDILLFFDYPTDNMPIHLPELFNSYHQVNLIAWSLGVAVANEIMQPYRKKLQSATAINGTIMPIDDNYGIPPAIFQATIDNLLDGGITGFYRRMCKTPPVRKRFTENQPDREPADLKNELIALYNKFNNYTPQKPIFTDAIVCSDDKIVPPDNQAGYWKRFNVPYSLLKAPHFPFYQWSTWREIVCQNIK
jgi:biotin synthesis protein BioG